jgi:fused signal recognition particle receptor
MRFFSKISEGLKKTSSQLGEGLASIFTQRKLDAGVLEELEDLLIMSDMGVKTSAAIVAEIAEGRHDKDIGAEEISSLLADAVSRRLTPYATPLEFSAAPSVVLVVGVNGNGKTTTVGKLAAHYTNEGKKVMLVAADTFRAAAVEQLEAWAERSGAEFMRGAENADPAAVVYAGVERALSQKADIVFVDTAGRLHTKQNLMAELEKIIKVIRKLIPDAPHHVIQVLDATTGQNAVLQLREFQKTSGVTGIIVTKLDGTAKAGIIVALADEFKFPIHAIGVGEGAEDLQPFDAGVFARALVGKD